MVSAKRFLQDEPVLGRALCLFVERFANLDDPVLQVSAHAKTDDEKIAWTLLGTALYQDLRIDEIGTLLNGLAKNYPGEKLWTLPVPKGGDIEGEIAPYRQYVEVDDISRWFEEEWFKEKYVIYVPV